MADDLAKLFPGSQRFLEQGSVEGSLDWWVERLILKQSHTIWEGRPKIGKSHSLLQLSFDAANGSPVFGSFTCPVPLKILYIELEEPSQVVRARLRDIAEAYQGPLPSEENLRFFSKDELYSNRIMPSELFTQSRVGFWTKLLTELGTQLLVLTSLRAVIRGNMNEQDVAETFNGVLDAICAQVPIGFLLGHHTGKTERDSPESAGLGHTSFAARADAIFESKRSQDGTRVVSGEGRYPVEEHFTLHRVSRSGGQLITRAPDKYWDELIEEMTADRKGGMSVRELASKYGISKTTAHRYLSQPQDAAETTH